jgi:hypothetical protein
MLTYTDKCFTSSSKYKKSFLCCSIMLLRQNSLLFAIFSYLSFCNLKMGSARRIVVKVVYCCQIISVCYYLLSIPVLASLYFFTLLYSSFVGSNFFKRFQVLLDYRFTHSQNVIAYDTDIFNSFAHAIFTDHPAEKQRHCFLYTVRQQ